MSEKTLKEKAQEILDEKIEKIIPENLLTDTTIFDVTGAIPVYDGIHRTNSSVYVNEDNIGLLSSTEVRACYNNGATVQVETAQSNIASAINLTADKIKKDEEVLGVIGTLETGIDTSDATAIATDIKLGATAYVNGEKITGTLESTYPNNEYWTSKITMDNANSRLKFSGLSEAKILDPDSYLIASYSQIASRAGITSSKLKKDVTIFGVTGTYQGEGTDTSDADATADDLLLYKSAYVKGEKIEGTIGYIESWDRQSNNLSLDDNNNRVFAPVNPIIKQGERRYVDENSIINTYMAYGDLASTIGLTANKLKKNEEILGIIGTYEGSGGSGNIKLFSTIQEMEEDDTAQEGDVAVVMGSSTQVVTGTLQFDNCTFPREVTLSSAFYDWASAYFRAVDEESYVSAEATMTESNYTFNAYIEDEEQGTTTININFSSEDGINYVRTDGEADTIYFGTAIQYEDWGEPFNSIFGKFMTTTISNFDGVFQYNDSAYEIVTTNLSVTAKDVFGNKFYGANGIENGTLQLVDDLDISDIRNKTKVINSIYSITPSIEETSLANLFDMSEFSYGENIKVAPYIDTSNVTDTSGMFKYCHSLEYIPDMETSNVINMSSMFQECTSLKYIPNIETSNVENMNDMFNNCRSIKNVSNLDTTSLLYAERMFRNCVMLEEIPLINLTNVTSIQEILYECNKLKELPLLDTSNVVNMEGAFVRCKVLTSFPLLDTSNVVNMKSTFRNCENITSFPIFNTAKVTNMYEAFAFCKSITEFPLLDTSNVTNMYRIFSGDTLLVDVPLLDTGKVTDMQGMFSSCTSLTTVPLFDTSNVTKMGMMFSGCTSLTSVPQFNMSKVGTEQYGYDVYEMFRGCTSLTTIPLLDTSKAKSFGYMFYGCTSLTSVPQLDTSSATSMMYMFQGCTSLTDVPVFNTSKITSNSLMFKDCPSLTNTSLNNILEMCTNAIKITTQYYKTLKYVGLTQEQATICQGLSNYQAFVNAGWTTGY